MLAQIKSFWRATALIWKLTSQIKQPLQCEQQQHQYRYAVITVTTVTIRSKIMTNNQPQQWTVWAMRNELIHSSSVSERDIKHESYKL